MAKNIILSIESAIQNGSITLFKDRKEIASYINSKNVSRSEDLLKNISALLKETKISKNEIEQILFSDEIGSVTGLRIGQSIIKGLNRAIGCEIRQVSLLEALRSLIGKEEKCVCAVLGNRNNIFFRYFDESNQVQGNSLKVNNLDKFAEDFEVFDADKFVFNQALAESLEQRLKNLIEDKIINTGENLSQYLIKLL